MTKHRIIEQLEKLIEIGIALSEERSRDDLLEMILHGAKSITAADGGTLYCVEGNAIKMVIVHSTSLNIHLGGLQISQSTSPTFNFTYQMVHLTTQT